MTTSRELSRRDAIRLLAGAALTIPAASFAQSGGGKKIRIAVAGTPVVNAGYFWVTLPAALGYWSSEGYDVEVFPVVGSLQAVQQMATGGLEFVVMDAGVAIQANTMNNIQVRPLVVSTVVDWGLAVPQGSSTRTVADLKGKSVGIVSLASGGLSLLRSFLAKAGLHPGQDVQIIPVGAGAPALTAMQSGRVDGLMFWGAQLVSFQTAGAQLRIFRDPEWANYPDYSLCALQSTIDKDPAMVEAIMRGVAKATEFANASPECALSVHWKHFPETKPTGVDEATARRRDLATMQANLESCRAAYNLMHRNGWAWVEATPFDQYQDFLFRSGVINRKIPASQYVVQSPNLFERANHFDHASIIQSANSCKI